MSRPVPVLSAETADELSLTWFTKPATDLPPPIVATGVFDLLHVGHMRFLRFARAGGAAPIVGVESNARASARKGPGRPIVTADERAELLSALRVVDGVFIIDGPPGLWQADAYAKLLAPLRPSDIALTVGDPAEPGKREAARLLGAGVVLIPFVEGYSTTTLAARSASATSERTRPSRPSSTASPRSRAPAPSTP